MCFSVTEFESPFRGKFHSVNSGSLPFLCWEGPISVCKGVMGGGRSGSGNRVGPCQHSQKAGCGLRAQCTILKTSLDSALSQLFPWPAWAQMAMGSLGSWLRADMALDSKQSLLFEDPVTSQEPGLGEVRSPLLTDSSDLLSPFLVSEPYRCLLLEPQ